MSPGSRPSRTAAVRPSVNQNPAATSIDAEHDQHAAQRHAINPSVALGEGAAAVQARAGSAPADARSIRAASAIPDWRAVIASASRDRAVRRRRLQRFRRFVDDRVGHHFAGHLPQRDEAVHRGREADLENAELLVVRGGL